MFSFWTVLASAFASTTSTPPDVFVAANITKTIIVTEEHTIEVTLYPGPSTNETTSYPDAPPPLQTSASNRSKSFPDAPPLLNTTNLVVSTFSLIQSPEGNPTFQTSVKSSIGGFTWPIASGSFATTMTASKSSQSTTSTEPDQSNSTNVLPSTITTRGQGTTYAPPPMRSKPGLGSTRAVADSVQSTTRDAKASTNDYWNFPLEPTGPLPVPDSMVSGDAGKVDQDPDHEAKSALGKTIQIDPVAWGAPDNLRRRNLSTSTNASPYHKPLWPRFFAAAYPQLLSSTSQPPLQIMRDEDEDEIDHGNPNDTGTKCITCPRNQDVVCINGTHYGFCDEYCVDPRVLKQGMKCVDGKIFGVGLYGGSSMTKESH
ncbi:hypothetical protein EK21DRAFT_111322 [Setomelanomma holmii]|uniref:Uncharacterized protein n=1 Tax=Setomelanomma holmii TaxID=210430 RepID=A0A9P4LL40_9PLEO|nr:hypothetical protein EK21DRAFT_111322 [Setomelanomma holmii]